MLRFEPWKITLIVLLSLAGLIYTIPNFFSEEQLTDLPDWVPQRQIVLGLDLQGGSYLLLEVDTNAVQTERLENLRADGVIVRETVLGFADFENADEGFMSGNMNKVTPVTAFDDRQYQIGPVTRLVRDMYWDWARSTA